MTQDPARRTGQGIVEYLVVIGAIILAILGLVLPIGGGVQNVVDESIGGMDQAAELLAQAPAWVAEREQEPLAPDEEEEEEDASGLGVGPGFVPPPVDLADASMPGGGPRGGGGGGGGGGGSGGGGVSGSVSGATPPPFEPAPSVEEEPPSISNIGAATAAERDAIITAANLLLQSAITFQLFDFSVGAVLMHTAADIVRGLLAYPIQIGMMDSTIALAAVRNFLNEDGTVKLPPEAPILLLFDRAWLAGATTEMIAAVLAHEGWHVTQIFTGIMDDFVHYPRVVDIEYEAFVASAAVWDTVKDGQSDPSLDGGSACVAMREARCKEMLATDIGYSTDPRNG